MYAPLWLPVYTLSCSNPGAQDQDSSHNHHHAVPSVSLFNPCLSLSAPPEVLYSIFSRFGLWLLLLASFEPGFWILLLSVSGSLLLCSNWSSCSLFPAPLLGVCTTHAVPKASTLWYLWCLPAPCHLCQSAASLIWTTHFTFLCQGPWTPDFSWHDA